MSKLHTKTPEAALAYHSETGSYIEVAKSLYEAARADGSELSCRDLQADWGLTDEEVELFEVWVEECQSAGVFQERRGSIIYQRRRKTDR